MTDITFEKTIEYQLNLMESYLKAALKTVRTAQSDLDHHNLNTAIGGLLQNDQTLEAINALHHTIITLHRITPQNGE